MLLQQSPFRGEDEDEIYDAILADEPLYPIHMPRDSVSILQKLLTREPDQRLGSGPTDAQEIMSQPFFRNINWEDIYHKRVQPPFLPTIKSATDTSNFDSEFTSVTPVLTPVQSGMSSLETGPGLIGPMLTLVNSSVSGYAGGIPRLFLYGRLRVDLRTERRPRMPSWETGLRHRIWFFLRKKGRTTGPERAAYAADSGYSMRPLTQIRGRL